MPKRTVVKKRVSAGRQRATSTSPREALKLDYAVWLIDPNPRKGTQQEWAKAHDVTRQTLWEWQSDSLVVEISQKAEALVERGWVHVLETQFRIATDLDHINCVQAATFLAKAFGRFKPDKVDITVDRVAYVEPGVLRDLAAAQPRPN